VPTHEFDAGELWPGGKEEEVECSGVVCVSISYFRWDNSNSKVFLFLIFYLFYFMIW